MIHIRFLLLEEIIKIHAQQIERFGGLPGIRDQGLLESALYEPQVTFDTQFLYNDIFEMAAAYAYGIIKNHPFLDGNKRTGMISSLLFLSYHDHTIHLTQDEFFKLAIALATSKMDLREYASYLKKCNKAK
jgi:death on curing protein